MFFNSENLLLSLTFFYNCLTGNETVFGPGGELANAYVTLWTAGPTPLTPGMQPGDFTAATFPGYTQQACPFGQTQMNFPNGAGQGIFGSCIFQPSTTVPEGGQAIKGYAIYSGDGDLYAAEQFTTPINLLSADDFIELNILFGFAFQVPSS